MLHLLEGEESKTTTHLIHRGYFRILDSLEADITHGNVNKLMRVVFRQAYAEQIIDKFVEQLPIPSTNPILLPRWRSSVLNPILQRQLNGFGDDDPSRIERHFRGLSDEEKELFYLMADPLAIGNIEARLRQGIMHVTTARWHLGLSHEDNYSKERFKECEKDTCELIRISRAHGFGAEWEKRRAEVLEKEHTSSHYVCELLS